MLRAVAVVFTVFIFWQGCSSGMKDRVLSPPVTTGGKKGFTKLSPDGMPTRQEDTEERMQLFQYDPKHKGHAHNVSDERGRIRELVTVALDPPIFEIHNFLSDEECDHLIALALASDLDRSAIVGEAEPSFGSGDEAEALLLFDELDEDGDGRLDLGQVAASLEDVAGGLLPGDDVAALMKDFKLDLNNDGHLGFEEFRLLWTPGMTVEVQEWVASRVASKHTSLGSSKVRVSDQTWLDWQDDDLLPRLRERVAKLLQLPNDIVFASENLQVVRYKPGGHYHGHHDSQKLEDAGQCSHIVDAYRENVEVDKDKAVRLCRFATVMFYLNDVQEGGETAFPFADMTEILPRGSTTKNTAKEYHAKLDANGETLSHDPLDFSNHCYDSNLLVKPEKGKAVVWYNHQINISTGWMGELIDSSVHGGCDVKAGKKWIANSWINVDDDRQRQREYHSFVLEQSDETYGDEEEEGGNGEDDPDFSNGEGENTPSDGQKDEL